jgi:hypothetical protein
MQLLDCIGNKLMKMTHPDITAYPKFASYVKKSIPEIIHVKSIVKAMQEIEWSAIYEYLEYSDRRGFGNGIL